MIMHKSYKIIAVNVMKVFMKSAKQLLAQKDQISLAMFVMLVIILAKVVINLDQIVTFYIILYFKI